MLPELSLMSIITLFGSALLFVFLPSEFLLNELFNLFFEFFPQKKLSSKKYFLFLFFRTIFETDLL